MMVLIHSLAHDTTNEVLVKTSESQRSESSILTRDTIGVLCWIRSSLHYGHCHQL